MTTTLKQINSIREELEKLEEQEEQQKQTGELICISCKTKIKEEKKKKYYLCIVHRLIFCESCAKNKGKMEINHRDAPSCHRRYHAGMFDNELKFKTKEDCILEPRSIQ